MGREREKRIIYYFCKECGMKFKEKEYALKCEQWCKKHKSCNIEITRHAVD